MRLICRRSKKVAVSFSFVFLIVWIFLKVIELAFGHNSEGNFTASSIYVKKRQLKAFITSAYYYPTSKSLGDNALALVMSINLAKPPNNLLYTVLQPDPTELVISARNATSSVLVSTPYARVTPHEVCQIITIFATAQLLPNVQSISMVGDNEMTEIPFSTPSYSRRDVIVCTSPLFVSEQWQNFLFAVHIYKRFGAYMNLYLISAVTSFYELMKEYEREGYMTIQPWVKVHFPGVQRHTADSFGQVEFRNQAASQSDCLLQFKESARFITFLDLDDVLIPRIAPTFAEEFQELMNGKKNLAYIFYHKENYDAVVTRDSSKFSLKRMFESLKCKHKRETGKIVVDPANLNYTWIHFPPILPNGLEKYEVTENVITHLKTITWSDEQDSSSKNLIEPLYYDNSSAKLISSNVIIEIEDDLRKMLRKPQVKMCYPHLPRIHHFTDLVAKCYNDRYYRYHYSGRIQDIKCPGPQLCGFTQHPKINCIHVNATHHFMNAASPITFYYATDYHFTSGIGCYSH